MTKTIDNPLGVISVPLTERPYIELWEKCKRSEEDIIFSEGLEKALKVTINKEFVNNVALHTAIYLDSCGHEPNYTVTIQQGLLVYAVFRNFLEKTNFDHYNVVDVGTARGFTALCMAKALEDTKKTGTIHTIDVIPHNKKIYWRSIGDLTGKKTRHELIEDWSFLRDNFIKFYHGPSTACLPNIDVDRIHFAFLDGKHDYENVSYELSFIFNKQKEFDSILCDDFTRVKYDGLVEAVLEYIEETKCKAFYIQGAKEDPKHPRRGYMLLER
jgi:hypothetical protein